MRAVITLQLTVPVDVKGHFASHDAEIHVAPTNFSLSAVMTRHFAPCFLFFHVKDQKSCLT